MGLIAKLKGRTEDWHPDDGAYPSLFNLGGHSAAVKGKGGVYALWHLGVRPQWLHIAAGNDLHACLVGAARALAESSFRANGGIFAAWAFVDALRRPGIVSHLRVRLAPALPNAVFPGEMRWTGAPKPVEFPLPPGTTEP